jgi:predicted xylan-binding protein with Ca-dependent carbohydrate-binding module
MRRFGGSWVAVMAVLSVAVFGGRHSVWPAEADAISVDLRTFKFKVRDEIASLFGYDDGENRLFYYTAGAGETTIKPPADGEYEIVIKASCDPALNERAKFKVSLDGQPVGMETLLTADDPKDYTLTTSAKAGERKLGIEFTNDAYKENEYDRNFYVHRVTLKRMK